MLTFLSLRPTPIFLYFSEENTLSIFRAVNRGGNLAGSSIRMGPTGLTGPIGRRID